MLSVKKHIFNYRLKVSSVRLLSCTADWLTHTVSHKKWNSSGWLMSGRLKMYKKTVSSKTDGLHGSVQLKVNVKSL